MSTQNKKIIFTLIVAVLFLSALVSLLYLLQTSVSGKTAVIYQNGSIIRKVTLDKNQEAYSFTLGDSGKGYNTICVKDGKIGVIDTDCPDKICQSMGMVSGTAYPVSCLPHKLVIRIFREDDTETEGIDTIAR